KAAEDSDAVLASPTRRLAAEDHDDDDGDSSDSESAQRVVADKREPSVPAAGERDRPGGSDHGDEEFQPDGGVDDMAAVAGPPATEEGRGKPSTFADVSEERSEERSEEVSVSSAMIVDDLKFRHPASWTGVGSFRAGERDTRRFLPP
ncbi:unnamed protein product, partial [Scytosiphon promiscuus]